MSAYTVTSVTRVSLSDDAAVQKNYSRTGRAFLPYRTRTVNPRRHGRDTFSSIFHVQLSSHVIISRDGSEDAYASVLALRSIALFRIFSYYFAFSCFVFRSIEYLNPFLWRSTKLISGQSTNPCIAIKLPYYNTRCQDEFLHLIFKRYSIIYNIIFADIRAILFLFACLQITIRSAVLGNYCKGQSSATRLPV